MLCDLNTERIERNNKGEGSKSKGGSIFPVEKSVKQMMVKKIVECFPKALKNDIKKIKPGDDEDVD